MVLFTNWNRTDIRPIQPTESEFEFYDRAAGANWDAVRTLLDAWLGRVDPKVQPRLLNALMARPAKQSQAAFWELFLHETFLSLGFTVTFEPQFSRLADTDLTPDFLLERGNERVYVEALVVNDRGTEDSKNSTQQLLQNQINSRLHIPGFMLGMSVRTQGYIQDVEIKRLVRELEEWLNSLNVESVWSDQTSIRHVYDFSAGAWAIEFFALALDPDQRATPLEEIIGIRLTKAETIDSRVDPHKIRDAIREKERKYRTLDAPLIVAVQVARMGSGDRDIRFALFGGTGVDEGVLKQGRIDPSWTIDVDGVWVTQAGPKCQNVSAIISLEKHLEPAGVAEASPRVWINPWAIVDVSGMFPWSTTRVNTQATALEEG